MFTPADWAFAQPTFRLFLLLAGTPEPLATFEVNPRTSYGTGRRLVGRKILSYISGVRFSWDLAKAKRNVRKHGVSFAEASTAFEDPLGAYYPDSLNTDRFILIGYSRRQRLLYVVHAEVELETIRIIGARKATTHEKTRYEND